MPFDVNSEALEAVDWYDMLAPPMSGLTLQQVQNFRRPARLLESLAQMSRQLDCTAYVSLRRYLLG